MRSRPHITQALQSGGFSFHYYVGRTLKIGFFTQCCIVAAIAAGAILVGSVIDGSLVLEGRDVGLLEHPGIWTFFALQIALPLSIRDSLKRLLRSRIRIRTITTSDNTFSELVVAPLLKFLRVEDRESKCVAAVLYCVGLTAFVWNTYQNQLPGVIVPYDFWDSKTYLFGFWITRLYKLYLFGWLLPYIGLIHIGILIVALRLIRRNRLSGKMRLVPFHPDGVGGLGFMPGLVTTPIIVTVLIGAMPTAAAFEVHRAADVTPLIGLAILILSVGVAYLIPILFLRSDIVALKRELVRRLRFLQQKYYSTIVDRQDLDFEALRTGNEALDYFEKVCTRVQMISNYPHFRRVLGYIGLALTPSVISLAFKIYDGLLPTISPLLKKP